MKKPEGQTGGGGGVLNDLHDTGSRRPLRENFKGHRKNGKFDFVFFRFVSIDCRENVLGK